MQNLKHKKDLVVRKQSEEGIAIVIVLLAVLVVLWGMKSIVTNSKESEVERKKIVEKFGEQNRYRFVHQMIADDELCTATDFRTGITGWTKGQLSVAKPLTAMRGFVNYNTIAAGGGVQANWPSSPYTQDGRGSRTDMQGRTHTGIVKVTKLQFFQPPFAERPPVKNEAGIWRIPVDVHEVGTVNNGGEMAFNGGIHTYIELDAADQIVSCYKDVSSRSLCLDLGMVFEPKLASGPKCHPK